MEVCLVDPSFSLTPAPSLDLDSDPMRTDNFLLNGRLFYSFFSGVPHSLWSVLRHSLPFSFSKVFCPDVLHRRRRLSRLVYARSSFGDPSRCHLQQSLKSFSSNSLDLSQFLVYHDQLFSNTLYLSLRRLLYEQPLQTELTVDSLSSTIDLTSYPSFSTKNVTHTKVRPK